MDKIDIRPAKISEINTIQDLSHALFESDGPRDKHLNHNWPYEDGKKYFKKRIIDPEYICVVADINNEVIGYLSGAVLPVDSWRPVKRTELENMFVAEKFRREGVGKKLIEEFIKWSKGKKADKATVDVYASNKKAIKFYKREGFTPEALNLEIYL